MFMRQSMYMYAVRAESMQVCVYVPCACVRARGGAALKRTTARDLYHYGHMYVDVRAHSLCMSAYIESTCVLVHMCV